MARTMLRRRTRTGGFTLIELLVVMAILGLLLSILLPSLHRAFLLIEKGRGQAVINTIHQACELYKADFQYYPPNGREDNKNLPKWNGSELLPLLLVGYGPDDGDKGVPFDDGTMEEDDGQEGNGYRVVRGGMVYGPYYGTDDIPIRKKKFICEFGDKSIEYVRYDADDSSNPFGKKYTKLAKTEDGALVRTDFILLSEGPDGKMGDPNGDDRDRERWEDTLTNFEN